MDITYIKGDATQPNGSGIKIITHICNDIGGWGKGFVLALSKKWKIPEEAYRQWHRSQEDFQLGMVQFVKVEEDIYIANMIGQHGIYKECQCQYSYASYWMRLGRRTMGIDRATNKRRTYEKNDCCNRI